MGLGRCGGGAEGGAVVDGGAPALRRLRSPSILGALATVVAFALLCLAPLGALALPLSFVVIGIEVGGVGLRFVVVLVVLLLLVAVAATTTLVGVLRGDTLSAAVWAGIPPRRRG